jgi:hypothetical protein
MRHGGFSARRGWSVRQFRETQDEAFPLAADVSRWLLRFRVRRGRGRWGGRCRRGGRRRISRYGRRRCGRTDVRLCAAVRSHGRRGRDPRRCTSRAPARRRGRRPDDGRRPQGQLHQSPTWPTGILDPPQREQSRDDVRGQRRQRDDGDGGHRNDSRCLSAYERSAREVEPSNRSRSLRISPRNRDFRQHSGDTAARVRFAPTFAACLHA